MAVKGPIYIPGISHGGPPPWLVAEGMSDQNNNRNTFTCDNLEELRSIPHSPKNHKATLLGEITPFDGLLQGDYYWIQSSEPNDNVSIVRGHDYQGWLWKKFN